MSRNFNWDNHEAFAYHAATGTKQNDFKTIAGKRQRLDELRTRIEKSDILDSYNSETVVLMRGSVQPDVLFIGEAPGKEEDEQGVPFVGKSGKLLDEWISYCGIPDNKFAVTNCVFKRPPNNRTPTDEEKSQCVDYLMELVMLLEPNYIVCVGKQAMEVMMPKKRGESVLANSGRFIDGHYYIVPHPAYFLRNGGSGWEEYLEQLRMIEW